MLLALHIYVSIQDPEAISRVVRIFSKLGFDTTYGQHRDLTMIPAPVDNNLNDYWEITILKSGSVFNMGAAGGAALATSDENIIDALGDYGTALGVMLQLIDDCRDAFTQSQEAMKWEISLPLLLYLMTIGEEEITYPEVTSKAEWSNLLREKGVINAISSLLLEWKIRALESLKPLGMSDERLILESIPSLILERVPMDSKEA
jgi:geranylgeranyl pyrophosphate synthase